MKLDPGMHIGMHLVYFGKPGVTIRGRITADKLIEAMDKWMRTQTL
jgi:hypothetical protein